MRRPVEVTPDFCVLGALLLLLLPLELILAAVSAALFHELCHWIAVRLLGGRVAGITVGAGGMVMETPPMDPWRELVCALAGPVGSFLIVTLCPLFPLLSLCALVQGCFNLLPLYPLDGGRAVGCALAMIGREQWMKGIEIVTLLLLLVLAIGVRMGIGPVMAWGVLAMRKIPCKEDRFGVQ